RGRWVDHARTCAPGYALVSGSYRCYRRHNLLLARPYSFRRRAAFCAVPIGAALLGTEGGAISRGVRQQGLDCNAVKRSPADRLNRRIVELEDQYQRVFSALQRILCCTACKGAGVIPTKSMLQRNEECECRLSARVDILGIRDEAWPPPKSNR